jgi:hypothetical protein
VSVAWPLPFEVAGHRYDNYGQPAGWIHSTVLSTVLGRREYVFLQRIWPFWPLA